MASERIYIFDTTLRDGEQVPGCKLNTTEKIEIALQLEALGVDIIAISFVRIPEDVITVKQIVTNRLGEQAPLVIAKLERPEALENLEGILDVADGVMVARGDLGVEMAPEDVPGAQKQIIQEANRKGKIVITATQMLESMIHNPLPTRAEASDVANAVYDGTDAVMLSGETAAGDYPLEAVKMMDRIVRHAESNFEQWGHTQIIQADDHDDAVAICLAARELAHDRDVEAIAVFTRTGRTALLLSKARPGVPVLAFTPLDEVYRRLSIGWGVIPHHVPWANTVEEMIEHVEKALKEKETIKTGQQVVIVTGFPIRNFPQPNMALLHTVR
jgi:pyruvate kinase